MAQAERFRDVDWLGLARRPFREMFVFSGRSTRSEAAIFFIIGLLANMTIITIVSNGVLGAILLAIKIVWRLLWSFPWIALFVRRLRDQNRSGWWALLLAAPATTSIAMLAVPSILSGTVPKVEWRSAIDLSAAVQWGPAAAALFAIYLIACLALLVLFLLPGTPGPNRYGPDPRL